MPRSGQRVSRRYRCAAAGRCAPVLRRLAGPRSDRPKGPLARRAHELPQRSRQAGPEGDPRSYRVNFDKLKAATGFQCIFDPITAIDQIVTCLENKVITEKELNESVNITADDPIRKLQTGLALRYAQGSAEEAAKLASKL